MPDLTAPRRTRRPRLARRGGPRPGVATVAAVLVLVVAIAVGAAGPVRAGAGTGTRVPAARVPPTTAGDATWILSAQLPGGAIATYPDQQYIDPYVSSLAAIGVSRAYALTRTPRFAASVWAWLRWRCAHTAGRGYVDEHRIVGGVPVSVGDVDAIDSEAALFLLALHEQWRATGDTAVLGEFAGCITESVDAMEALQDFDGLTWAKPTWRVKYLMNETEVFAGFRSAATLARALGDRELDVRATAASARVAAGLALLWNPATGGYDWAVHGNGARIPVDWRILYPDSMEQAWAAVFGLSAPVRSRDLMTSFVDDHPAWAQPSAVDLLEGAPGPVGYWPIAGWGLLAVGRRDEARAGAASIRAGADATRWAWPLDVAAVGGLIVLDSGRVPVGVG
jgi:hypothetical protein